MTHCQRFCESQPNWRNLIVWLLDANMDVHLVEVLESFHIACDTAIARGWGAIENGELVAAAVRHGFDCLLTRDRMFGESAAQSLHALPGFAVVIVRIPQSPWRVYEKAFRRAWEAEKIVPAPGKLTNWPRANTA